MEIYPLAQQFDFPLRSDTRSRLVRDAKKHRFLCYRLYESVSAASARTIARTVARKVARTVARRGARAQPISHGSDRRPPRKRPVGGLFPSVLRKRYSGRLFVRNSRDGSKLVT